VYKVLLCSFLRCYYYKPPKKWQQPVTVSPCATSKVAWVPLLSFFCRDVCSVFVCLWQLVCYLLCRKMSVKHTTPFQLSHCLEYGLIITGHDVKKVMSCVQCNLCVYDGQSGDDVDCNRMQSESICLFTPPYHLKLYRKHLKKQHAKEYQGLSKAEK
jgi:hypothetical protein